MSTDYSRPLSVASGSTEDAAGLERRLQQSAITISCDHRDHLPTVAVLVANLRRLPVALYLQSARADALTGADQEDLIACAAGLDPGRSLQLGSPRSAPTLHLHVGGDRSRADISAVADGHGVRLRRRGHPFPGELTAGTGLGSVLTAAVLTAEAFKEIVGVRPSRHRSHQSFDFNPVTLAADGPVLPFNTIECTALIGAGAIGTAVGLILHKSEVEGKLTVVDPELFRAPNVMTYSLGTQQDAVDGMHKTHLLERELPYVDVQRVEGTAQDFINLIDKGSAQMPTTVLGAVDSIDSRHQIAKIYAALTLDGSTGGIAGTTVGLGEAVPTGPCLRCYYPNSSSIAGPSPEQQLCDITGLDITLLADGDRILSTKDLLNLSPEGARLLTQHLGKPICGLARTLGLTGSEDAYRPSAAFVSQQAAALMIGALIARADNYTRPLRDLEYDALFGPGSDLTAYRRPRAECSCQVDKHLIQKILDRRASLAAKQAR